MCRKISGSCRFHCTRCASGTFHPLMKLQHKNRISSQSAGKNATSGTARATVFKIRTVPVTAPCPSRFRSFLARMRHSAQKKVGFSRMSAETVGERAGIKMAGCGVLHNSGGRDHCSSADIAATTESLSPGNTPETGSSVSGPFPAFSARCRGVHRRAVFPAIVAVNADRRPAMHRRLWREYPAVRLCLPSWCR